MVQLNFPSRNFSWLRHSLTAAGGGPGFSGPAEPVSVNVTERKAGDEAFWGFRFGGSSRPEIRESAKPAHPSSRHRLRPDRIRSKRRYSHRANKKATV
ncbi:MAG: hypothetical protein EA381_16990 [Planctomycetaceae bacterium]|nr:MAG: hypothetical protein EA381_16990 [Planctomycetaceae bacterium]